MLGWLQLSERLVERDWRWHCERWFQRTLARGVIDIFFIDTSPAIQSYHAEVWAGNKGEHWHTHSYTECCPPPAVPLIACSCDVPAEVQLRQAVRKMASTYRPIAVEAGTDIP